MKKQMRSQRIIILFLLVILLSNSVYASDTTDPNYSYALKLKELGVFIGSDTGFELDRKPTRIEGLVMLIRLLGKEDQAKALAKQPCVFTDVPSWAIGYANYAKDNQLTQGISATLFGSADTLTLEQYTTFLLRSLQYSEAKGDFTFSDVLTKGISVGIITDPAQKERAFTRSTVAKFSYETLLLPIKQSNTSLAQYLVNINAMDETTAVAINVINHPAVIDGKLYALKDAIFYDLGESSASIDVLSSATIQGAAKTDVYDHYSNSSKKTQSLLILPIEGYTRLVLRVVTSNSSSNNTVSLFDGNYGTFTKAIAQTPKKTTTVANTSLLISVDLTQFTTKDITLWMNLEGSGHFYIYNVFLE